MFDEFASTSARWVIKNLSILAHLAASILVWVTIIGGLSPERLRPGVSIGAAVSWSSSGPAGWIDTAHGWLAVGARTEVVSSIIWCAFLAAVFVGCAEAHHGMNRALNGAWISVMGTSSVLSIELQGFDVLWLLAAVSAAATWLTWCTVRDRADAGVLIYGWGAIVLLPLLVVYSALMYRGPRATSPSLPIKGGAHG